MADARDTTATSTDHHHHQTSRGAAAPPAAKGGATISITIVLLALLVASVAAFQMSSPSPRMEAPGVGDGSRPGAEPVEQAVGHGGVPGFNSRLDAFRAWAKLTWMKLQRPRSDDPRYDAGGNGIAGSAAEATKKSLEMGKETAEQAAASAAGLARDTVKGVAAPNSGAEL
ncbi:hypothetical protein CFC21_010150 [Triticum aestivum]|nr:uncharacterized protein LOC109758202 [Aegilops tauschii subsp. strangulata]XP_044437478.1 uncharacterized protein LOC123164119 [Triticum aestivum]KAF6993231.1 hypothetical protein CFC21_010150 [Triticum aestivum]